MKGLRGDTAQLVIGGAEGESGTDVPDGLPPRSVVGGCDGSACGGEGAAVARRVVAVVADGAGGRGALGTAAQGVVLEGERAPADGLGDNAARGVTLEA